MLVGVAASRTETFRAQITGFNLNLLTVSCLGSTLVTAGVIFFKENAHLNHLCLKSMSFCTALCRMASAVAGSDRQRCLLRIC